MNQEPSFELLLRIKELESETKYKIEQDKNNKNLFYFTEPYSAKPFAALDYNKEIENARTNFKTSTLRECSTIFLERVRGIIKERENRSRAESRESEDLQAGSRAEITRRGREISRSEESENRSRAETSRRGKEIARNDEIRRRDRELYQFYDSKIWQQELTPLERIKALELNKKFEEQHKQSEPYRQQALKAYQKSGATLAPNIKNPQNEITSNTQSQSLEIATHYYEEILNADKGFRTEKTIQYTIEQIAKEYHLPIEQVKKEVDRILQRETKENPKTQEQIQSKTQNQEANKVQDKVLPPKRESKTLEKPKPIQDKEQSLGRGR